MAGPRSERSARSPLTPGTPAARADRGRAIAAAVLLALAIGHLVPGLLAGDFLFAGDWNSLAARWSSPLARIWDIATVLVGAGYLGLLLRPRGSTRRPATRTMLIASLAAVLAVAAVFCILTLGSDYR